jgi:hypothetical protein
LKRKSQNITGTWETKAVMPTAAHDYGSAVVDDKIHF